MPGLSKINPIEVEILLKVYEKDCHVVLPRNDGNGADDNRKKIATKSGAGITEKHRKLLYKKVKNVS